MFFNWLFEVAHYCSKSGAVYHTKATIIRGFQFFWKDRTVLQQDTVTHAEAFKRPTERKYCAKACERSTGGWDTLFKRNIYTLSLIHILL